MRVHLRQVSPSASEATVGTHQVLIDRPAAKGGADAGPMGGELFLAAVGGCFMSNLLAAIRARDVDISGVHTEVIATLADSPTRFVALDLRVSFGGSHDPELLQKLVDIADRGCIMLNTLRATLELRIGLTAPASGSD